MANIYGTEITRKDLMKRVGNMSQIASIKPYEFREGKSTGIRAFDVTTGGGLEFTVLESKCLDIYSMKYKGLNINFVTKPGLVSPELSSPHGAEFLRSFQGGFLYTCGLSNVGVACVDEGKEYGIHGRIASTPADKSNSTSRWENDEYLLEISGEMREAALFNENLVLKRHISTRLGAKSLFIHDEVENQGFEEQSLMILYHFNLGYPLLGEDSRLVFPVVKSTPRDDEGRKGINEFTSFSNPIDHFKEQVFYHDTASDKDSFTYAALINDKLGMGVYIKYNTTTLPNLVQWKSMASGDYVLGLEPANCHVEGRCKEKERGTLKTIAPYETVKFDLEIGILDGAKEIYEFEEKVKSITAIL